MNGYSDCNTEKIKKLKFKEEMDELKKTFYETLELCENLEDIRNVRKNLVSASIGIANKKKNISQTSLKENGFLNRVSKRHTKDSITKKDKKMRR